MTEHLQTSDEAALDGLPVAFVNKGAAHVVIGLRITQPVVGADQDGVADCRRSLRRTTLRGQALVLGGQVGSFPPGGDMSGFDHGGTQPGMAFAGLAAVP
jgi:hypothetical protein